MQGVKIVDAGLGCALPHVVRCDGTRPTVAEIEVWAQQQDYDIIYQARRTSSYARVANGRVYIPAGYAS